MGDAGQSGGTTVVDLAPAEKELPCQCLLTGFRGASQVVAKVASHAQAVDNQSSEVQARHIAAVLCRSAYWGMGVTGVLRDERGRKKNQFPPANDLCCGVSNILSDACFFAYAINFPRFLECHLKITPAIHSHPASERSSCFPHPGSQQIDIQESGGGFTASRHSLLSGIDWERKQTADNRRLASFNPKSTYPYSRPLALDPIYQPTSILNPGLVESRSYPIVYRLAWRYIALPSGTTSLYSITHDFLPEPNILNVLFCPQTPALSSYQPHQSHRRSTRRAFLATATPAADHTICLIRLGHRTKASQAHEAGTHKHYGHPHIHVPSKHNTHSHTHAHALTHSLTHSLTHLPTVPAPAPAGANRDVRLTFLTLLPAWALSIYFAR
ncbi:uncharacterized protein CLUP02_01030 [Colletotrichum lupini]|uniref:Uncharacterized protein n=1 Tax=Colletotrichum lupini TaxID=145971 RepID=A0A9Q8SBI9_9PEZI|nr:uncharacterized protein CLUP02_01030 [Colletotrichum lupini]UQC74382.1 hypothetical protein CLUP02_01030 [Colletotrichum lupini]